MKAPRKQRRARCILCLLTAVLAVSFVAWDAAMVQGAGTQVSGPAYLVAWLAVVVSGGIALLLLAWAGLARGWRALSRIPRDGAAGTPALEPELPAAAMVPRF